MKPPDLIAQARRLASTSRFKPRQVDLKRSVSAAYYAMFHTLAKECADTIAGPGGDRSEKAWTQIYRALDHGGARNACQQAQNKGFPASIVKFAEAFVAYQRERHSADYDPQSVYARSDVEALINDAAQAIEDFHSAPRRDRRAFVALVLLRDSRR